MYPSALVATLTMIFRLLSAVGVIGVRTPVRVVSRLTTGASSASDPLAVHYLTFLSPTREGPRASAARSDGLVGCMRGLGGAPSLLGRARRRRRHVQHWAH